MEHTRHRVITEQVVGLALCKSLNLSSECRPPHQEDGIITRYEFVLSLDVAITAYLFNSMAALIAGFKDANGEDSS
jgi:hypothetical protein